MASGLQLESDFKVCNVCQYPGTFENALEVENIPSNIRKFKEQKFTVWRCSFCNSLHSKELVDLNHYYKNYIAGKPNLNYFLRCAYYNRLELLRKYGFKKNHKLLDFGCNQGLFLSFLNQLGYENVFGYDPYVPKYSDQKFLSKKYDFITAYDVIEHVDEPSELLTQFASFLKKGGLLILGTPNADEIKLSDLETPELHQPYHRHILSEKALRNLAFSKGLKVIGFYKRWYLDTLYPMVNARFALTYVRKSGNVLDVLVEMPRWKILLISPLLIFYGFTGYFFRWPGNMTVVFRC
ncbi:MAG: class I SAM-dependent methyltransferase [Xenococcaceae cyanobacterium MO_188.B32]|nr:class I SAM-dependent methyltransferase [Xenococcaceae cyanobacterium MO_188.B32]